MINAVNAMATAAMSDGFREKLLASSSAGSRCFWATPTLSKSSRALAELQLRQSSGDDAASSELRLAKCRARGTETTLRLASCVSRQ